MPDDRLPTPERVLVVAAHPDDIEFGAAGTVARWVREGSNVRYLLATRGDKGSDDASTDPQQLATLREREQRAAAAEVGVEGVEFLDEPDGQVLPTLQLRERITRAIRELRPEVVMTHDPTVLFVNNEWVNHPDHRAVGQAAIDAVFPTARDPLNFREHIEAGLAPWKVAELFCGARTRRTRSSTSARRSMRRSRPSAATRANSGPSTSSRAGFGAEARSSANGQAIGRPRASDA